MLVSEWDRVGDWRRALSTYDVRIEVMPLMALAENEPGVYENAPIELHLTSNLDCLPPTASRMEHHVASPDRLDAIVSLSKRRRHRLPVE